MSDTQKDVVRALVSRVVRTLLQPCRTVVESEGVLTLRSVRLSRFSKLAKQHARTPGYPSMVSNTPDENTMSPEKQFRRILPIAQTLIAILCGGWGEWQRIQDISRSLGWYSMAVFHIWPWPLKFAMILNMPALVVAALIDWPINSRWPDLPEYLQLLLVIPLVALLWYVMGCWLQRRSGTIDRAGNSTKLLWAIALFFVLFSAVGAALASASSVLLYGLGAWIAVGVGMAASAIYERLRSKRAQQA